MIATLLDWLMLGSDCGIGSYFFPGHRLIGVIVGIMFTTGLYTMLHAQREANKMLNSGKYKKHH